MLCGLTPPHVQWHCRYHYVFTPVNLPCLSSLPLQIYKALHRQKGSPTIYFVFPLSPIPKSDVLPYIPHRLNHPTVKLPTAILTLLPQKGFLSIGLLFDDPSLLFTDLLPTKFGVLPVVPRFRVVCTRLIFIFFSYKIRSECRFCSAFLFSQIIFSPSSCLLPPTYPVATSMFFFFRSPLLFPLSILFARTKMLTTYISDIFPFPPPTSIFIC